MALEGAQALKLNLLDDEHQEKNYNLDVNFEFAEEEDAEGNPVISGVSLCAQTILPVYKIQSFQVSLLSKQEKEQLFLDLNMVNEPKQDVITQARLQLVNTRIFDLIQQV